MRVIAGMPTHAFHSIPPFTLAVSPILHTCMKQFTRHLTHVISGATNLLICRGGLVYLQVAALSQVCCVFHIICCAPCSENHNFFHQPRMPCGTLTPWTGRQLIPPPDIYLWRHHPSPRGVQRRIVSFTPFHTTPHSTPLVLLFDSNPHLSASCTIPTPIHFANLTFPCPPGVSTDYC